MIDAKTKKINASINTLVVSSAKVGIAFAGFDQADNSKNKNNIYDAKLYFDGLLIYNHQLDNISFDDARYVNFFGEKISGQRLQKCFTTSCYPSSIYKTLINQAIIEFKDTLQHQILLEVSDEKNNKNSVSFFIKTKTLDSKVPSTIKNAYCDKDCEIIKEDVILKIPKGALTRSLFVPIYFNKSGKLNIGQKEEIILKPIQLSVKVNKPLIGKESKMVLINEGNCLVGKYENGFYKTETKQLGVFELAYDTIAPDIQWLNKPKSNQMVKGNLIFKISDQLSGIDDYHVWINDVWQIADFDAKTSTLICPIDNLSGTSIKIIKVLVTDKAGNKIILNKEL